MVHVGHGHEHGVDRGLVGRRGEELVEERVVAAGERRAVVRHDLHPIEQAGGRELLERRTVGAQIICVDENQDARC